MLNDELTAKLQRHYIEAFPSTLDDLEHLALGLEKTTDAQESYFALYRQIHSLKGSGATYGFPIVTTICHQFEEYLSERKEDQRFTSDDIDMALAYIDLLKQAFPAMQAQQQDFSTIEANLESFRTQTGKTRYRVLLVESSNHNSNMITKSLEQSQVKVSVCKDGLLALNRLLYEHFDFLITSNQIPSLNGQALIAAVRLGSYINKDIPIALITSDADRSAPNPQPDLTIKKDQEFIANIQKFVNERVSH